jgi:cellulose synthase/poly-beta-1,6-N-acetylglucosamine synthase-like glycosyltransferase
MIHRLKARLGNAPWYVQTYRIKEQIKQFMRHDFPQRLRIWRIALKERPLLLEARRKYEHLYRNMDNPLVSVTIPTYNRGELLTERTLPSVLNQTYQNFEIVIVGDCCTDDTEERIAKLNDPHIRFYNLPQRGPYPRDPLLLWYVAGVPPVNRALEEARGLWIAHLDDDDVWKPYHLECMLAAAYEKKAELIGGPIIVESPPGHWKTYSPQRNGIRFWREFMNGGIPHSSFVFRSYLKLFKYDVEAWKLNMPADRHLSMRMVYSGVRYELLKTPTVVRPLRPGTTRLGCEAEDRAALTS